MSSPSRFAAIAIALTVSSLSISAARAEAPEPAPQSEHEHARAGKAHYPMKAEDFKRLIEKRVSSVKNAIDKKLERHGVSADRRAQIRHTVDVAASGDLRAAVEKVTADGVVTKEESVKVHTVADRLRGKVRKELRDEKNAEKKGAGANPPRDEKPAKKKASDEKKPAEEKKPAPPVDE